MLQAHAALVYYTTTVYRKARRVHTTKIFWSEIPCQDVICTRRASLFRNEDCFACAYNGKPRLINSTETQGTAVSSLYTMLNVLVATATSSRVRMPPLEHNFDFMYVGCHGSHKRQAMFCSSKVRHKVTTAHKHTAELVSCVRDDAWRLGCNQSSSECI